MKIKSSHAAAIGVSAITIGTLTSSMEVLAAENSDSSVLAPSEVVDTNATTNALTAGDVASNIANLSSDLSSSKTSKELVDSATETNETISRDYLAPRFQNDEGGIPEDEAAAEEFWKDDFPYANAEIQGESGDYQWNEDLIKVRDDYTNSDGTGDGSNNTSGDEYNGTNTGEINDEIDDTGDSGNTGEDSDVLYDISSGGYDFDEDIEFEVKSAGMEQDMEALALELEATVLGRAKRIDEDVDSAGDSLKDATVDSQKLAKSDEAMDEADSYVDVAVDGATKAADGAKTATEDAKSSAESAVGSVVAQSTTKEAAMSIVEKAEESVENAEDSFVKAKADYERALEDFMQAQADYEIARQAYLSNKTRTASDLQAAKESYESALNRLDGLEAKLSETKEELVEYSAEAILAAEANKYSNADDYVTAIIKYYYLVTEHGSLDCVTNFSAEKRYKTDDIGKDTIHVTYDIIEDFDTGETTKIEADFSYMVGPEEDDYTYILIFRANLFYWYADANGKYHFFTPYEASQYGIEGQPETYRVYNVSGSYVPRYEINDALYSGTYISRSYDSAEAFEQGFYEICDDYDIAPVGSNWAYRGVGTASSINRNSTVHSMNVSYDIQYDKVVDGKKESFDISPAESSVTYNSYSAAFGAVEAMGKARGANAIGIDREYSNLSITSNPLTAGYINYGLPIVVTGGGEYQNFLDTARKKIEAYNTLMGMIADARSEYENAAKQLEILQNQIQELEKANDTQAIVRLAELQVKLDKAKDDFDTAKENLVDAKEALDLAKAGFESRFKDELPSVPAFEREHLEEKFTEIEELEEEEEIEEEVEVLQNEVVEDFVPSGGPSSQHNYGPTVLLVQEIVSDIEDFVDVKPEIHTNSNKPKEAKKETITRDGVKERLPWFIGLGTVSTAGAGVAAFEAKRRAAMRILDKLNQ